MKKLSLVLFVLLFVMLTAQSVSASSLWDCDSPEGSWGINAVEPFTDGDRVALRSASAGGCACICYAWTNGNIPDLTAYAEDALHISLYVEDASAITVGDGQGRVELMNENATKLLFWEVSDLLSTGWNDLTLPFADAEGELDLSQVVGIRFLQYGESAIGVDDLYVGTKEISTEPAETKGPAEEAGDRFILPLWNSNSADGSWGAAAVEPFVDIDRVAVKSSPVDGLGVICFGWLEGPRDLTAYAEAGGVLHVSLYVEDANALQTGEGYGRVEIGNNDNMALAYWEVADLLSTGWNDLTLPFADAKGESDLSKVNYFRFFQYGSCPIGVDNLYVEADEIAKETADRDSLVLLDCDDLIFGSFGVELEPFTDGDRAAIRSVSTDGCPVICFSWQEDPLDLSPYAAADGALHISLYVEDAGAIQTGRNRGHVELGSSSGLYLIYWDVADLLSTGWNNLTLPFADAEGEADLSAIDYFRFYQYGQSIVGVDDIYAEAQKIGGEPAETEEPVEEEPIEAPGLSTGAIVGIAAGAGFVVGAIVGAVIMAASKKKKK